MLVGIRIVIIFMENNLVVYNIEISLFFNLYLGIYFIEVKVLFFKGICIRMLLFVTGEKKLEIV